MIREEPTPKMAEIEKDIRRVSIQPDPHSQSHYIGAPMYMETKVRYLWYSDVLNLIDGFANQQPTKPALLSAIMKSLRAPTAHPRRK